MSLDIAKILLTKAKAQQLHNLYLIEPGSNAQADECLDWTYNLVQAMLNSTGGKKSIANHPDVLILSTPPENKAYTMAEIEPIFQFLHYEPSEYNRKFLIIEKASALSTVHINKLLKTFEEPPIGLTSLLINSNNALILPTLLSRSIKIKVSSKLTKSSQGEDLALGQLSFSQFSKTVEKNQYTLEQLVNYVYDQILTSSIDLKSATQLTDALSSLDEQRLYHNSYNTQLYTLYSCLQQCGESQSI